MNLSYISGETVHLTVQVNNPQTKAPMDVVSVDVLRFVLNGTSINLSVTQYTKANVGIYEMVIPTINLEEGNYQVTSRIYNGDDAIVIVKDDFTVRNA